MLVRTRTSLARVLAFVVCNLCVLHATEYGENLDKRGADGTDRTGTAMALRTGTGSTTPANPTCKITALSLLADDVYYYACCEGTTIAGEEHVVNWDCNPARKTYAKINESLPFYCGGIGGEDRARKRCDERWRWLASENCFKWTECFRGICPFEAEKRGSAVDADFCGDGRCDATESSQSCPVDCCPLENDRCQVTNNTCPESCCNEPSCCEHTFGSLTAGQLWLVILLSVVGGIVLFNLVCCCCCWCCFRKCCGRSKSHSNGVV